MIGGFHSEVLLAVGYALLLALIAAALEGIARHSQRRSEQYHTAGFQFHKHKDAWECPAGAALQLSEINHELRIHRYRAPAHTCNRCPIKSQCTDSNDGREISVSADRWLESGTGRLQRGISLTLLILAGMLVAIEWWRHKHGVEQWLLAGLMVIIPAIVIHLARHLREAGKEAC